MVESYACKETKPFAEKLCFILEKEAEKIILTRFWVKGTDYCTMRDGNVVSCVTVDASPNKIEVTSFIEAILKLKIQGVPCF